jgi:UDP-glucose 4-epimerase
MQLTDRHIVVTGGAGLVGAHLTAALAPDNDVVAVDNLAKGDPDRLADDVAFVEGDLTDSDDVASVLTEDVDVVFHLAAHSNVNRGERRRIFEENTEMTYNLLERMDEVGIDRFAFTSSSTVYGEAPRPTPEDYAPLEPISEYGAAKLADEALVSTYAHAYDVKSWVFRFANIVGPYQRGNVLPDFIQKLVEDPETLTILGDGRQEKSYLHVEDCVDAIQYVVEHADAQLNTYNLGTRTTTSVTTIADIVAEEMGLDPDYEYTGGDRGWKGDVPKMRLSIEKLRGLGWTPATSSDEAVRRATGQLIAEITGDAPASGRVD